MANEEPDSNPISDHSILEWIEGTLPFLPPIFDEPYGSADFNADPWWPPPQGPAMEQEQINNNNSSTSFNSNSTVTTATSATFTESILLDHQSQQLQTVPLPSESGKKRKASEDPAPPKTFQVSRRSQNRRVKEAEHEGDTVVEQGAPAKKSSGNKKGAAKAVGNNGNSNNKDGRWAEQLLNPCAAAITASNPSRVQHLLYVINELASLTGDANHRLAAHGLRALTHHLSNSPAYSSSSASPGVATFSASNPKFFTESLINFSDISPWFRIPNSIANSSILQILAEQSQRGNLHIVDIGVSHGIQWPTLLEELTRRSGGPPPLVRITFITQTNDDEQARNTPFVVSPQGYNSSSRLLTFAKKININLQISRLDNLPLQNLNSQVINSSPDETLIICTQFRLHNLNHYGPDDRTNFLRVLRSMEPRGVVLSENNSDCSCHNCVDFATGFSRRVEYLWRFLDSTSAAYKGRESDERRMMEGEAAKALTNIGEMNERKEKWCERMTSVGFTREVFGEDAVDGARALLRKYDSNWEIKVEDKDGCLGLWWKGQPVSFCSLWKIDQAETK